LDDVNEKYKNKQLDYIDGENKLKNLSNREEKSNEKEKDINQPLLSEDFCKENEQIKSVKNSKKHKSSRQKKSKNKNHNSINESDLKSIAQQTVENESVEKDDKNYKGILFIYLIDYNFFIYIIKTNIIFRLF